jgi:MoxR-like ATPase
MNDKQKSQLRETIGALTALLAQEQGSALTLDRASAALRQAARLLAKLRKTAQCDPDDVAS